MHCMLVGDGGPFGRRKTDPRKEGRREVDWRPRGRTRAEKLPGDLVHGDVDCGRRRRLRELLQRTNDTAHGWQLTRTSFSLTLSSSATMSMCGRVDHARRLQNFISAQCGGQTCTVDPPAEIPCPNAETQASMLCAAAAREVCGLRLDQTHEGYESCSEREVRLLSTITQRYSPTNNKHHSSTIMLTTSWKAWYVHACIFRREYANYMLCFRQSNHLS